MGKSKEQASAPSPNQKPWKTNGTQKISTGAQRIFEIFELQRAAVPPQATFVVTFACSLDSQAAEVTDRVSRRSVCLPRVLRKIHSAVTHERFLLETTREQIEQTKNC